uniref:Uncharacterized protein n=1 Tax=Anguilla anguilla TaxID=7936 RepID=A0A0E9PE73_ANGAN
MFHVATARPELCINFCMSRS